MRDGRESPSGVDHAVPLSTRYASGGLNAQWAITNSDLTSGSDTRGKRYTCRQWRGKFLGTKWNLCFSIVRGGMYTSSGGEREKYR